MDNDKNLMVICSENPQLKNNKGLSKPITSGNPTFNAILAPIRQVPGNLGRTYNIKYTYVDEDEPWSDILTAAEFLILSTENRLKYIRTLLFYYL